MGALGRSQDAPCDTRFPKLNVRALLPCIAIEHLSSYHRVYLIWLQVGTSAWPELLTNAYASYQRLQVP